MEQTTDDYDRNPTIPSTNYQTDRRTLLRVAGVFGAISSLPGFATATSSDANSEEDDFDLLETTIADLHAAFDAGVTTSEEVTQQYLDRIEEYDDQLNTAITVNPNAVDRARNLDAKWEKSGPIGPLHGIPIYLKDNVDTDDLPTTGGSTLLENSIPPDSATLTEKLREAGGIILVKANMGEFAYGSGSEIGGHVPTPYDLERDAGGSSAGPGAGIAANLGTIGIGTDTAGSVRIPAGINALAGLRPTTGLVSRDGIIPLSETQDTAGPMARTVRDMAILLDTMVGYDPADQKTAESIDHIPDTGYCSYLNRDGLEEARIGVLRDLFGPKTDQGVDPEVEAQAVTDVIEAALADLEKEGAMVVDPVTIPDIQEQALDADVMVYEVGRDLEAYLRSLDNPPASTLDEVIESGEVEGIILEQLFEDAQAIDSEALDENVDYLQAVKLRSDLKTSLFAAMAEHDLDAFVYPMSSRTLPETDAERAYFTDVNSSLSSSTGFPSLTVPAGFTDELELPIGLEFMTKPFTEPTLIEMAYAYEQATLHRRPPAGFGAL